MRMMYMRRRRKCVMFNRKVLYFAMGFLVSACSPRVASETSFALNINHDGPSNIVCETNIKFLPEPGITQGLNEDMAKIAEKACGAPINDTQLHSETTSHAGSLVLTSTKIEFVCSDDSVPAFSFTKELPHLCGEALKRFKAQQE